eukprot:5169596-Prymnesium_polylepis.1
MDNDDHNKATHPAACEQTPRSTAGVLVASYGRVEDIEAKLRGSFPAMSGCDERVMHGAYSQGAAPSAALFSAPELPQGFGIAVVHEGLPAGASDQGACGMPSSSDGGLVLAGWTPGNVCGEA